MTDWIADEAQYLLQNYRRQPIVLTRGQGTCVWDEQGKQYYLDAHVSYRRACLNAIEYLKKWGYSGEQAYLLLSCAPVEGRISGIVDIPNACATLAVPTEIFDFDIRPNAQGPTMADRGGSATVS